MLGAAQLQENDMFYTVPVAYWVTWLIFIANGKMTIGILYAVIAAVLAMFIASKIETGEWMWALKALFGKD